MINVKLFYNKKTPSQSKPERCLKLYFIKNRLLKFMHHTSSNQGRQGYKQEHHLRIDFESVDYYRLQLQRQKFPLFD
jgi:hypothetical protein